MGHYPSLHAPKNAVAHGAMGSSFGRMAGLWNVPKVKTLMFACFFSFHRLCVLRQKSILCTLGTERLLRRQCVHPIRPAAMPEELQVLTTTAQLINIALQNLSLSLSSSNSTFSKPSKRKCISEVMRIGSIRELKHQDQRPPR